MQQLLNSKIRNRVIKIYTFAAEEFLGILFKVSYRASTAKSQNLVRCGVSGLCSVPKEANWGAYKTRLYIVKYNTYDCLNFSKSRTRFTHFVRIYTE